MSNKAATAFDYRRYIELVQVLSSETPYKGMEALCKAWNVERVIIYPPDGSRAYVDNLATINALAKAAVENHRSERE